VEGQIQPLRQPLQAGSFGFPVHLQPAIHEARAAAGVAAGRNNCCGGAGRYHSCDAVRSRR
jgi:hypothetical protein